MKVEIHAHTSRYSSCSRIMPNELVAMAEAAGYDAVFLTDHGKVWSPRAVAELREWSDRVRILPGVEIALGAGVDLLVLGAQDPVYERLTSPSEVFAQACAEGCLTVVAHPFRWIEELPAYCRLADAIEVCSCNHPRPSQAEMARQFARRHGLAPVYGSDAHGLNFMNRFWIETEEPFETHQEFRRVILSGRYENRTRESETELPPHYKAAGMAELPLEDRAALAVQPTR